MNCDKNYEIFSVSSVALIFWAKMCIKKTGEVTLTKAKQKKKKNKKQKKFLICPFMCYHFLIIT